MSESEQRAAVIAVAREWIGTPYHHAADIKSVGVDCGMLIVRAFIDAGLCTPFDPRPYEADWHLHRTEERYLGFVLDRCIEVADPQEGDIVIFRYGRCYSHGGIVTKVYPLNIVHAFRSAACVIEEELERNKELCSIKRERRFFSIWKA